MCDPSWVFGVPVTASGGISAPGQGAHLFWPMPGQIRVCVWRRLLSVAGRELRHSSGNCDPVRVSSRFHVMTRFRAG